MQFLFVNNRHVSDKALTQAVKEAFGSLLPSASSPVFILHLSLPHEVVDVNVHPRKETVTFVNQSAIFQGVKQAVMQTLSENNITFTLAKFSSLSARVGETTSFAGKLLKDVVLTSSLSTTSETQRYIQFHKTYIISSTQDGISIVDQHAAHERVLYERFKKQFVKEKRSSGEVLKKPIQFELSITDKELMQEYLQIFTDIGFTIDMFQGNTIMLRAIPPYFVGRNIEKIIQDMLVDLQIQGSLSEIDLRSQRMLAFLSCRAAVMAGDILSEHEMQQLLEELEHSPNNETCPHGRPTRISISTGELDAAFKRK